MRPLVITDCDEVLVHMVRHFRTWLDSTHQIDFAIGAGDFASSMSRRDGGALRPDEMWTLLDGFFPGEMARQTLVPGAAEALATLAEAAEIVILTNLSDACHGARVEQLAAFGIAHRLHLIADPELARAMPPAPAAHARIDDWAEAARWIAARLAEAPLTGPARPGTGAA